jgi:hypothetical protein
MNLIPISPNILVNPECITCVEQKTSRGVELTYVWVGNRSYLLEIPLDEFYKNLNNATPPKQYFAG